MSNIGDLRKWIKDADELGGIRHIKEIDWDQEIACVTELNRTIKHGPAFLFDEIKGYPPGFRVLTSAVRNPPRAALTLGLPIVHTDLELVELIRKKWDIWESSASQFPPKIVDRGAVLENIDSGDNIDLLKFPVPKWHPQDGGRYIGTGDAVITRDPDTGEVNLGTYRVMVHDSKTAGLYISPGHHGRIDYEKYHQRGQKCPVAISVGHHPLFLLLGSMPLPGQEYEFGGAVRGESIAVIEEEVTGLPIPADAEIVIAGWCHPGVTRQEGPFGEWTGYYASKDRPAPVVNVERIYYRNNPIILGSPPFRCPSDAGYYTQIIKSAMIHNELIKAGIPGVRGVWLHDAGIQLFIAISLKQQYAGHARQAALLAAQGRAGAYHGRFVVVVDDDIDPTDTNDVLWAMCTRVDPEKDIDILRRCWSTPLDPIIRKPTNAFFNSKAIIDATKPYEWIDEFPKSVIADPEVMKRVMEKWGLG